MDVLLLSNSTNAGAGFLEHARGEIEKVAGEGDVVFVPFALEDWDGYTERVSEALPGVSIKGAHASDMREAILRASCVFVGGGNTFRLLATLQHLGVTEELSERVLRGECSYIGSSAGTNIAGPSIRTTNDMPIVETNTLQSLGIVPFLLNPHYTDGTIPGLMAESRAERIQQLHEHSSIPVLALYEGAWLRVKGDHAHVEGDGDGVVAKVFEPGEVRDLFSGDSVSPWWGRGALDDLESHLRNVMNQSQQ